MSPFVAALLTCSYMAMVFVVFGFFWPHKDAEEPRGPGAPKDAE
jgi:hypothetical protein